MAVPRARKKTKKIPAPSKPEQTRIMEANWLCLAVAVEQLYSDHGWRVKRINKLIDGFWAEMNEAHRLQIEDHIKNVTSYLAKQAGKMIDADILRMCSELDPYRSECYMLCVGCLVKALRKLKVSKMRCKLIVGEIFVDRKVYEPWSVYKECERITGFNVRERIQW